MRRENARGRRARTAAIDGDLLTATPDELHQLGFELCQAGRYRDAEVCDRRAIELQQDFPEAHNNLGFASVYARKSRTSGELDQVRGQGRYEQCGLSV